MSIVQVSKIQVRSGNIVDLPQLDEAELGWATDAKLLFVGKTTPNENIEVLTSYSSISFGQLDGASGNLNINANTVANGQALVYSGNSWVNRGGNAGGLITLGNVGNVKIDGGAIGYVLETDGAGNLSWTPKSTIIAYITNVTQANPGVVTTTEDNFFTDGAVVTITDVAGMVQLNGNSYYANVLTSNTFSLYSDAGLTTTVDTTGFTPYTANGRAVSLAGSGGSTTAGGSNTTVQFNNNNLLDGDADFTWNFATNVLTVNGNINTGNLISSGTVTGTTLVSNIANGTAPLTVTSTTKVANLNVDLLDGFNTSNVATANTIVVRDANGNITANYFSGVFTGTLSNGTSNVSIPTVNGNVLIGVGGVANVGIFTTGGANITGNANITGFANVVGNLNAGNVVATGNVNAGNSSITGNITAGNVSVNTGTVRLGTLTTGASGTAGTITGNWSLSGGSRLTATYADLSEYYQADAIYGPGTVLEFGGVAEVTEASDESRAIAGVVSTDPAYVMNSMCPGEFPGMVALQGRVPCKVRGNISKGDMIISAGGGYGRASSNPLIGSVIGKSLQNYSGPDGTIEVAIGRI